MSWYLVHPSQAGTALFVTDNPNLSPDLKEIKKFETQEEARKLAEEVYFKLRYDVRIVDEAGLVGFLMEYPEWTRGS